MKKCTRVCMASELERLRAKYERIKTEGGGGRLRRALRQLQLAAATPQTLRRRTQANGGPKYARNASERAL